MFFFFLRENVDMYLSKGVIRNYRGRAVGTGMWVQTKNNRSNLFNNINNNNINKDNI